MAPMTNTPPMAHIRVSMASGTLRCLNNAPMPGRGMWAPSACTCIGVLSGSRTTQNITAAMIRPGIPTSRNTLRQVVTSSSCVAMIGPMALPHSEIMHWKMPLFMPRRLGCEASTATATPVEATGPSNTPITARITIRLTRPAAMPLNQDINEKTMTDGISTLRRPMRSDRKPMAKADMPQKIARMPTRLPRSW